MISPYIFVFGLLLVASLASLAIPSIDMHLYAACLVVLTLFLAFRYGQGTDWAAYSYIYQGAPTTLDFSSAFYTSQYHSEIGWKLICNALKVLGVPFIALSVCSSLIEMICIHFFIVRFSSAKTFSLMLFYPVVYLIYCFSAIRQGLVLCFFLGFMLHWLHEKRYVRFAIAAIILTSIHLCALIALPLLLIHRVSVRTLFLILVGALVIGIFGWTGILNYVIDIFTEYKGSVDISVSAIAKRAFLLLLTLFCYIFIKRRKNWSDDSIEGFLFKIYLYGFILYMALSFSSMVASRIAAFPLAVEFVLLPTLLSKIGRKEAAVLLIVLVLYSSFSTYKSIDASISESSYVETVTAMNYPYVSVFNPDDIYLYSGNRLLPYLPQG